MAMNPMLIIGCGGSGGKTVLGLRRRLELELRRRGWTDGLPKAWQLRWIDVPSEQESHPTFGPPLPDRDYLTLVPGQTSTYKTVDNTLISRAQGDRLERLVGWRPSPVLPLPIDKGAGQMRGVGRAVALTQIDRIGQFVSQSLDSIAGGDAELAQVSRLFGGEGRNNPNPLVLVISSLAGGTGAGIFMDVCDVVRGVSPKLASNIFGFLFTAEVFSDVGADAGMAQNTVCAVGELMSGMLTANRPLEALYPSLGAVNEPDRSGPAITFLLGTKTLSGGEALASPTEAYRTVTETLLTAMVNEQFQQDFLGYQVTNFIPNASRNDRGTAYSMLNSPRVQGSQEMMCGLVSSFGSSSVAVGVGRFGEWAQDRMTRSVIDHVSEGWTIAGKNAMGDMASDSTTNDEIKDFLVSKNRNVFIDRCGLWEENEPNGVEHNQVLEGILPTDELMAVRDTARNAMLNTLKTSLKTGTAARWQQVIEATVGKHRADYERNVEAALEVGKERFCAGVVDRVSAATSEWLADYGTPVTAGLVEALMRQCNDAREQLATEARAAESKSHQGVSQYVLGAFQAAGNAEVRDDSDFVRDALMQALGPVDWGAARRRYEVAADVLGRVVTRVVKPLLLELAEVGEALADSGVREELKLWPDDSGDVPGRYRPAPSEFVLIEPEKWGEQYLRLLTDVAGGLGAARTIVSAGGFEYGPETARVTAPSMVEFGPQKWWEDGGDLLTVATRLRPAEIRERSGLWLTDTDHAFGQFLTMGINDYLAAPGSHRPARLKAFEQALSKAKKQAAPLMGVDRSLMQRVHPNKDDLSDTFTPEPFPFPSSNVEAREIVERVLSDKVPPSGGWFSTDVGEGQESVLMTSVLNNPVQPAVVSSLTEPILKAWTGLENITSNGDFTAMQGTRTYNVARILNEAIPLTDPATANIIKGWILGRLFGTIEDPDPQRGFDVRYVSNGSATSVKLPWPMLRHIDAPRFHDRRRSTEWLPAALEHLPMAMMTLGADPTALDGYEQIHLLGANSGHVISAWIEAGETPTNEPERCKLGGDSIPERADGTREALTLVRDQYTQTFSVRLVADWHEFQQIPFGYTLRHRIDEAIDGLLADAATSGRDGVANEGARGLV